MERTRVAKSSTSELGGWPVLKNGPVSEGAAFNEMMYRPDPGACYDADLNEELEGLFQKNGKASDEFRESDHPRDNDGKFGSKGGSRSAHSTSSWMSDLVSRYVPEAAHAPPPTPAQKQAISAVEGFKYSDWIQGVMAEHPHKEDKATKAKYAHAFAEFTDEYYHMLRGVPSEQRRKVSENLAHVAKLPHRVLLHLMKEEGVEAAGAGRALYSIAVHGKAPDTEDLNHLERLGIKLMVVAAGTVLEGVSTEMFTGFALGVIHHALAEHVAKIAGATGRIAHEKIKAARARDEGEPGEEALLRQFIELLAASVAQPLDHAAAQ